MSQNDMRLYDIAVLPGDGIGREVMPPAIDVLEAVGRRHGFGFRWDEYDWSCDRFLKSGTMMPQDGVEQVRHKDAILLGAVGDPRVPDHVSLWGMLVPLRQQLRQYACVRPVRLLHGVRSPLADRQPEDIDFIIVRECNEGEYSQIGGHAYAGFEDELVFQGSLVTKRGCDRILRFAFDQARARPAKHITLATKSNGVYWSMPYWDQRFAEIGRDYPDVATAKMHIDNLSANLVQHPDRFDVIVGTNLFGDMLADLGAAVAGSMGLAPSASLNPEREYASMFEPVHGSAPDIFGQGIANPIAQVWAASMMLDHLGQSDAAAETMAAITKLLASKDGPKTPDLGGNAKTKDVASALVDYVNG